MLLRPIKHTYLVIRWLYFFSYLGSTESFETPNFACTWTKFPLRSITVVICIFSPFWGRGYSKDFVALE